MKIRINTSLSAELLARLAQEKEERSVAIERLLRAHYRMVPYEPERKPGRPMRPADATEQAYVDMLGARLKGPPGTIVTWHDVWAYCELEAPVERLTNEQLTRAMKRLGWKQTQLPAGGGWGFERGED